MSEAAASGGGSPFLSAINNGGGGADGEGPASGPPANLRDAMKRAEADGGSQGGAPKARTGLEFDPLKQGRETRDDEDTQRQRREPPNDRRDRPETRETKEEAQERKITAKLRNGQTKEVTEKDLLDYYQRGESANQKFQEASAAEKRAKAAEAKATALLRDPKALLEHLINDGDGVKSVHEAYQELMKLAKMSPEEQQNFLRTKELENRDAQLRAMEEAEAAKAQEAAEDAQIDQHLDGLEDAFDKIGWFPSEAAEPLCDLLMETMLDEVKSSGQKGVTYRHIAQTIKGVIEDTSRDWLSSATDEQLTEIIGEKRLRGLMNGQVKAVQSKLPTQVQRNPTQLPRDRNGRYQEPKVIPYQPGDLKGLRAILDGR